MEHSVDLNLLAAKKRYEAARAILVIVAIAGTLVFSATMLWLAWESHKTQERLLECTTVGESCYEEQFRALIDEIVELENRQEQFIVQGSEPARQGLIIEQENARRLDRLLAMFERSAGIPVTPPREFDPVPPALQDAPPPQAGPQPSTTGEPAAPGPGAGAAPQPAPSPSPGPTRPPPVLDVPGVEICIDPPPPFRPICPA